MARRVNNGSVTNDNQLLPILIPSHWTATKQTDGWVYETVPYSEKDRQNEHISAREVARIPFDVEALKDIPLLEELGRKDWRLKSLPDELMLAQALKEGDIRKADEIAEGYDESERVFTDGKLRSLSPQERLALRLSDALRGAKYVIWREKESHKLRPGLFCKDLKQVTRALVAVSLDTAGGLGACERCGRLFRKRRASQSYCSTNCQVKAAMKRYRKRKKKTERKKQKKSAKRRPRR